MAKDNHTSVYFDRASLKFVGLEAVHIQQLKTTYKSIDVEKELSKMILWLSSSKLGKKRVGSISFIINWLNRAAPTLPTASEQLDMVDSDSPLRPLLVEYLQDLWKGKEHILALNTIKSLK